MDAHSAQFAITKYPSTTPTLLNSFLEDASDTPINFTNSVIAIVKEVGEMLTHIPYVKSLSGVVLQIIKIRDEIKSNKKRCGEIIDKVVRMSKSVYEQLAEVAQSKGRGKLGKLEKHLIEFNVTLSLVFATLEKHKSRQPFRKLINRGLDELTAVERHIDELNTKLILDILVDLKLEQAASTLREEQPPALGDATCGPDHILPTEPPLMIERDNQLDIAVNILIGIQPSRIAILGGGGLGKTTLARRILHNPKIVDRYEARYFLSCEGMPDIDTLLLGLGTMLDIKCPPSKILATIRRTLEKSATLLCLDNFETPWEPSDSRTEVEELLEAIANIPKLSLMITLRGEQRPSKVSWSNPQALPPLLTLSLDGSKSIVHNIAGNDALNDFTLQLLNATDGIPLAVTLVATLLRDGESSQSLWKRWSVKHTKVIHTGGNDRQSNLERSIALSVNSFRMTDAPNTRKLLAALSLLPEGFPDPDALESLQEYLDISEISTLLQTLRTVALVRVDETYKPPRIQMLSPIRFFCHQFLTAEIAYILPKITEFYVHLLLDAGRNTTNSDHYTRISPQVNNIHSVFQRAFKSDDFEDKEMAQLVQATIYLTDWSCYIGYYNRDALQIALAKTTKVPTLHADCLLSIGELYRRTAEYRNAAEHFRRATKVFQQEEISRGEAKASLDLGIMFSLMGCHSEAEDALKTSLQIFARENDKCGEAYVRIGLGRLYTNGGKYAAAEECLTGALQTFKKIQDLIGQADSADGLCKLYISMGNQIEAEKFGNESLVTAQQANFAVGEGNAFGNLGRIYLNSDRIAEASHFFEKALLISKNQSDILSQLHNVDGLGQTYIYLDRLAAAEALLTSYSKVELDAIQIASILATLGWLYICGNRFDKAEHYLNKALHLFRKYNHKFYQANVSVHLGTVYLSSGRWAEAEEIVKLIPNLGSWQDIEMRRFWVLGEIHIVRKEYEQAESLLDTAMESARCALSSYQHGHILRSLGTLRTKCGSIDLAIQNLQEALEFHRRAQWVSEQAIDLKRIAEAYKMLERSEESEAAFKKAEELMDSVRELRMLSP